MRPRQIPHYIWTCVPEDSQNIQLSITEDTIFTSDYSLLKIAMTAPTTITLKCGKFAQTYQVNPDTFIEDKYYSIYLHPNIETLLAGNATYESNAVLNGPHTDFATYEQTAKLSISDAVKGNILSISFEDPLQITKFQMIYLRSTEFPTNLDRLTNLNTFHFTALAQIMTSIPDYLFNMTNVNVLALDRFADPDSLIGKALPNSLANMPLTQLSWTFADSTRNREVSNIDLLRVFTQLQKFTFSPNGTAYMLGSWASTIPLEHLVYYLCNEFLEVSPETNPVINFDPELKNIPTLTLLTYDNSVFQSTIIGTFDSPHVHNLYITDRGGDVNNQAPTKQQFAELVQYFKPFSNGELVYMSLLERGADGTYRSTYIETFITNLYDAIVDKTQSSGITDMGTVGLVFSNRSGSTNQPLDGTYQQPADWDGTNGTPQSSLERLWVLANKYNINITYTS